MTTGISQYIRDQFPSFYQEGGDELIAFVEAYYEFIENSKEYNGQTYDVQNTNDIDRSLEEFVRHFKVKYLSEFPYVSSVDHRFVVKHIMDYYKSKGSEKSAKLLLKLLLGQETEIYYPGQDVLKPSDSQWVKPYYLEVSRVLRTKDFINKQITGSKSKATAFVESIVTKRVNGKLIDLIFLSDVKGLFRVNEVVTDDGSLRAAPRVIGSLTTISIDIGGRNNKIGDVFDVESYGGRKGKVRVVETIDATGRVDFRIIDGGWGYENNNRNDVKVSSAVLVSDNPNEHFIRGETILQPKETLKLYSATNFLQEAKLTHTVLGHNSANVQIASGRVMSIANTDSDWNVINEPSANGIVSVYPISGTFDRQYSITTTTPNPFKKNLEIRAGGSLNMEVTPEVGTLAVGETVFQRQYVDQDLPISNTTVQALVSETRGRIVSITDNELHLDRVFGDFDIGTPIITNTSKSANVTFLSNVVIGGSAVVSNTVNTTSFFVGNIVGDFVPGDFLKGRGPGLFEVGTVVNEGVSQVTRLANTSVMSIVDEASNTTFKAQVIGQNTTSFGIHGNTTGSSVILDTRATPNNMIFALITDRERTMIAPPLDANGDVIELTVGVDAISTGTSAGFRVGSIENEETVTMNTDFLGDVNVANVPYMEIRLNGEGSSIGFLDSINVISAGTTLYANGQILETSGGGYANGQPLANAYALVTTDATGLLTNLTVTDHGMGFYETPTHNLGGDATIDLNMTFGYGFPKMPHGDYDNMLESLLTIDTFTVGSISSLTRINPGINYNMNPFVWVNNKFISAQKRRNFYVVIDGVNGAFASGERLYQLDNDVRFYKGEVISSTGSTILVRRVNVNVSLEMDAPIYGAVTDSYAMIRGFYEDAESDPIGDNANILGNVISANGIATKLEVIDSGYGYEDGSEATLVNDNSPFIITGIIDVLNQGRGEGYWKGKNSHLNSEKRIHDNRYYQEFSYDIRCGMSIDKYENLVKKMIHVAGTRMFGTFTKNTIIKNPLIVTESSISIGQSTFNPLRYLSGRESFYFSAKENPTAARKPNGQYAGMGDPIKVIKNIDGSSGFELEQITSSSMPVYGPGRAYVNFDGIDDFMRADNWHSILNKNVQTFGMRFRPTTRKPGQHMLTGFDANGDNIVNVINWNNSYSAGRGGASFSSPASSATIGEWNTFFLVIDFPNAVTKIYSNGVLVATGSLPKGTTFASPIALGARLNGATVDSYLGMDCSDIMIVDRLMDDDLILNYHFHWSNIPQLTPGFSDVTWFSDNTSFEDL